MEKKITDQLALPPRISGFFHKQQKNSVLSDLLSVEWKVLTFLLLFVALKVGCDNPIVLHSLARLSLGYGFPCSRQPS